MLGGGRAPLIQSFGTEPQPVVEHCLAANRIRKQRDTRLTLITLLCGVVFLPGLLLWLVVFQLRRSMSGADGKKAGALSTALLVGAGILAVLVLLKLPVTGFWSLYLRAMIIAPVIGWYLAKHVCEKTARTCAPAGTASSAEAASPRRSPRRCPATPARRPPRNSAGTWRSSPRSRSPTSSSTPAPAAHTRHGHPLGRLAPRRGTQAARRQGDPRLPDLGRHTPHPRPAEAPGTRLPQERLPGPLGEPLDRGPRGRRGEGGLPARRRGRRRLPGQAARDPADLQREPVRQGQPPLPRRPVRAVGRPARPDDAGHRHGPAAHPAHRGLRPRPRPGARPLPRQAGRARRSRSRRRSASGRPRRSSCP